MRNDGARGAPTTTWGMLAERGNDGEGEVKASSAARALNTN